ncbi:MAG: hypothetical protein O3A25_18900 [Acidobacteria bacterium]|nr:hypothetical protein [Acidobacteriota bacterium]
MKYPLFVNQAYKSQSPVADDERTVNWYPERMESQGAITQMALYPTPGVATFVTVTEGSAGRGAFALGGRCFFVVGAKLIEVFVTNTYLVRGTVAQDGNPATFSSNGDGGNELFISSGGVGYAYDLLTNTLTTEIASDCTMTGMSYGFFQYLDLVTSRFYISDLFDGTTWDALQFAANSITPDSWKALLTTTYGQTWLLGEQSGQVWFNNGASPFPYALDPSGLIPYGIAATFSVQEAAESVTWLATTKDGDLQVISALGFRPQRISDYALEFALSQYGTVSDAQGETYRDGGHTFYVLSFPTEGKTWVYDFTTQLWHERGTWISEDNAYVAWRPSWHAYAFGKHLWCDRESGLIYEVSSALSVDAGSRPLRRIRRSPGVVNNGQYVRFQTLEVVLEPGLGLQSGQGSDPQILLRLSDDGGKTWSNERSQSAGKVGQYRTRVVFRRLGVSRHRVFEIAVSDPIPWRILDAYVDASGADTGVPQQGAA